MFCIVYAQKHVSLHLRTRANTISSSKSAAIMREHYILGSVCLRFVFGSSKLPQIELVVGNNAEVDAAGRYIPSRMACRGRQSSCTLLRMFYMPTARVSPCLFTTKAVEGRELQDRREPDTPLFFM